MIQLSIVPRSQKEKLSVMLQTYLKELNGVKHEVAYPYFDDYWIDTDRIPLHLTYEQKMIGFALLNTYQLHPTFNADRTIAEFYIFPPYRRNGHGRLAAHRIIQQFGQKWEIATATSNEIAIQFWQKIVAQYDYSTTIDPKKERVIWTFSVEK